MTSEWKQGTVSVDKGMQALEQLSRKITEQNVDWNEAETRFHFIDPFLKDCLGWPSSVIHVEKSQGGEYADYELGEPRAIIWEAKRQGTYFELPANPARQLVVALPGVMATSVTAADAIKQAQRYCSTRGVRFAVVCNGHQLIAFVAVRLDGKDPLEGRCLACDGYSQIKKHFPQLWQTLSPAGVTELRLLRLLNGQTLEAVPPKLASSLTNYHEYRYKSESQASLRAMAELLIEDIPNTTDFKEKFYRECYCESGALSQYALLSKSILNARYAALFNPSSPSPHVESIKPSKHELAVTPEMMSDALARRPFVLLGDVGVGKTSFLEHLIYNRASADFSKAIYAYVDLGSQAALGDNLQHFVLREIEEQLINKYSIDIRARNFVRGVYHGEIERFRSGIFGELIQSDPELYAKKLLELLEQRLTDTERHLASSVRHIVRGRKQQVILIIDNTDQRNLVTQQDAFIIAHNLAQQTDASVFIAVRPQTFHRSRSSGALSAYPQKVFSISPPRPEHVLQRRLKFALKISEGNIPVGDTRGTSLHATNISFFIKALLNSLRSNPDLVELLANITGGNIRAVIELVKNFIGSPNVASDKIIQIMEQSGNYVVPVHEFSKSAILGEYSHYHEDSSVAFNMFDVRFSDQREHFLAPLMLGFLNYDEHHRDNEGFVQYEFLVRECQRQGFTQQQTLSSLRRLANKRLIETTERVTFAEDAMGEGRLFDNVPRAFRITTIGAYHLRKWIAAFEYLDAMVFDTPIFDDGVMTQIARNRQSFNIEHRLHRAICFRRYLSASWHEARIEVPYFDWNRGVQSCQNTFQQVERFLETQQKPRN